MGNAKIVTIEKCMECKYYFSCNFETKMNHTRTVQKVKSSSTDTKTTPTAPDPPTAKDKAKMQLRNENKFSGT